MHDRATFFRHPRIDRESAVATFKALGDPTRLRMLRLLAVNRTQVCVCELADTLRERPYNVSRHLKILEGAGLVHREKEGRRVHYTITIRDDPTAVSLGKLIASLPDRDRVFARDQQRLEARTALGRARRLPAPPESC